MTVTYIWAEDCMEVAEDGDGNFVGVATHVALAERLAEAERDAARYRWLRANITSYIGAVAESDPDYLDQLADKGRASDHAPDVKP